MERNRFGECLSLEIDRPKRKEFCMITEMVGNRILVGQGLSRRGILPKQLDNT
jgi:hypothetical protein